jgi:hypothetical protein
LALLIGRFIATQKVELEFDALADEVEDAASPIADRIARLAGRLGAVRKSGRPEGGRSGPADGDPPQ